MRTRIAFIFAAGLIGAHVAQAQPSREIHAQAWSSYQIIMWHAKTARQYEVLRALGVTAAKVEANRSGETPTDAAQKALPIVSAGLGIYVENMATDFYSAYHRWFPHQPVNWKFLELKKKILNDNPIESGVFVREPSLSDPTQLGQIEMRLTAIVRDYAPFHPIFFNLGDETGIADLSAAWDFDYSSSSLSAMRVWLRERYPSLAALNEEWSTHFGHWKDVVPVTTTQAMARTDENYASWSDFKEWMDVAFARSISDGTRAVHAGAPWARSAIEGVQRPGWGGYDYSLLAPSVDVMEIYDDGTNLELAQSFNSQIVILTTPNWTKPNAQHVVWSQFLRGARGMVLWDPEDEFVTSSATPGSQARATAAFISDMHNGIGPLLMSSKRKWDRIAVLYSPASFRVQWMLDNRALGQAWTKRSAGSENEENAERAERSRILALLGRLGFTPNFVSDEQIARGLLHSAGYRMLVLAQTLALSPEAAGAVHDFVRAGGGLTMDGDVGLFDDHGRRLNQLLLSEITTSANSKVVRLSGDNALAESQLSHLTKECGLAAEVTISNAAGETVPAVKQYVFHQSTATFVALLADPTADGLDHLTSVDLKPATSAFVYNVRSGALLGSSPSLSVQVGNSAPTVLALVRSPLPQSQCRLLFHLVSCPQ